MPQQRYLDNFETNLIGSAPSHAIAYEGDLDSDRLANAFIRLCDIYPALRGRIRPDEGGQLLYVAPDFYPTIIERVGDIGVLYELAYLPWAPSEATSQLIWVKDERKGFVALRADHSIGDGTSFRKMFSELWRLYSEATTGSYSPAERIEELPRPPSDFFERLPNIKNDASLGTISEQTPLAVSRSIERRIHLPSVLTERLAMTSRKQKTSIHGIVCGAVLVALRDHGGSHGAALMACWSLVNLRNLVIPKVGPTETTNFAARHEAKVNLQEDADPVEVGVAIKEQLTRSIASHELTINPVKSPPPRLETSLEQRLATVSVSNNGIVPRFIQPLGVEITDFLIPAYPMTVLFPTYSVYTYDGRLSIRIVYPADYFTVDEIDGIVTRTREHLVDMGTSDRGYKGTQE